MLAKHPSLSQVIQALAGIKASSLSTSLSKNVDVDFPKGMPSLLRHTNFLLITYTFTFIVVMSIMINYYYH